jgi:predicted dienelactone hydrolase
LDARVKGKRGQKGGERMKWGRWLAAVGSVAVLALPAAAQQGGSVSYDFGSVATYATAAFNAALPVVILAAGLGVAIKLGKRFLNRV